MNRNLYIYFFVAAMLLAVSCIKDDEVALDTGIMHQDTIPDYNIEPIAISATASTTFADGDALIVSNPEILAEPATLAISGGIGSATATFVGELKVKKGAALSSGVTTFAAALSNAHTSLTGDGLMTKVKEVASVDEGIAKYGCLACKNFVYNSDANLITLVQSTAFVKFDLNFVGAKVIFTTADKKVYRKYLKGNEVFAVPGGTSVESQILEVSQTVDAQKGVPSVLTIEYSVPENCLPGVFSVAGNKQVFFSKGNLLYKPYNGAWNFAPYQYFYCVPVDGDGVVGDEHSMYLGENDWIDHFGCGMWLVGGDPVKTSQNNNDYVPPYDETYTRFAAPPAIGAEWRALTIAEWSYLTGGDPANKRSNADHLFDMSIVCGVVGLVVLPDESTDKVLQSYDAEQWAAAESQGAMFMPASGYRVSAAIIYMGAYGTYWSETVNTSSGQQNGVFIGYPSEGLISTDKIVNLYLYDRSAGCCVRLVRR